LVVGALIGGTVPVGRSISNAFVSLGQEARLLDFSNWGTEFSALLAARDAQKMQAFVVRVRTRLLEEAERFQPEIILGLAQSPLSHTDILAHFRQAGIKLGYWFIEDYRIFPYWKNLAASFDQFYVIQQEPFFTELKAIGCKHFSYLPAAFDDLAPVAAAGSTGVDQTSARREPPIPR